MQKDGDKDGEVKQTETDADAAATVTPLVKRSQSVERRRQGTPRSNNSEISAARKMLFIRTRSLSVLFQGECFSSRSVK
ncbi:QWRF motif-containing protein 2-like [Trifolium medium]|uniref:QWRF motif-containing protein 2-like n=1 Tax=Trifolium medium TaxID=97028 RepID=A0A392PPH5_9FABA|nr:QWRF motif-containing protein 2-like [Trifolium medium]